MLELQSWEPDRWVGGFLISSTRQASIWQNADSVEPAGTRIAAVITVRNNIKRWMMESQKSYKQAR